MCGILAYFQRDGSISENVQARLRSALPLMAHRGPDADGFWVDGPVAMGHRRLSIIDLSPAGRQPMFNEDASIAVTFNGEIYNFADIRHDLLERGHVFKSQSDTEVILHAYEEWGESCVTRFNGMFAFALWDKNKQRLWVVRDRMGIKPLYYTQHGGCFVCASEIHALLAATGQGAQLNPAGLDAYFSIGYMPGPDTLFQGIRKLEPGHALVVEATRMQNLEYWDVPLRESGARSMEQAAEEGQALFKDCVRHCLISDVPVGIFLSGGLDSSAVTAMVDALGSTQKNTFTASYAAHDPEDESIYARQVAHCFGASHHEFILQPGQFEDSLRVLVRHCEEPIVEAPAVALFHLSRLAAEHVKVLLSGEGADELFAGYELYAKMAMLADVQRHVPVGIRRLAGGLIRRWPSLKTSKYADWLIHPIADPYEGISQHVTESMKDQLYTPEFRRQGGSYVSQTFERIGKKIPSGTDLLTRLQYADLKVWLPDNLLLKADKMTMAASVELRVPFLDHRLVEWAFALPPELRRNRHGGKLVLKRMMASRLPANIIHRKKMGFPLPLRRWFRHHLTPTLRARLTGDSAAPWFQKKTLDRLIGQHETGQSDYSQILLSLLVLDAWKKEFRV